MAVQKNTVLVMAILYGIEFLKRNNLVTKVEIECFSGFFSKTKTMSHNCIYICIRKERAEWILNYKQQIQKVEPVQGELLRIMAK
jgi:hypothetical protein